MSNPTPESLDFLVERVRLYLPLDARHPSHAALTELAERVKAAEREREQWWNTASRELKARMAAEAQRDELVEALAAWRRLQEEGKGVQADAILNAALAKVRSES